MVMYNIHPALNSGYYCLEKYYIPREQTFEQIKERQQAKKLKKKRRKGGKHV